MKKIFLLLLIFPLLVQSCLKDDTDNFSKSSADRVEEAVKAHREVLIGATNGWVMSMYPNKNQIYGGYNLFLKFTEKEVTVASELENSNERKVSMWLIDKTASPVLIFDTYNPLFHFFSEPNVGIGPTDEGMGGDFTFIILEAKPEMVKLKGLKTGNILYMHPIEEGADWTQLLEKYQQEDASLTFDAFHYKVNDKTYPVSISYRTLNITYPGADEKIEKLTIPYIVTLTGYKFYKPIKLDGVEVSEMKYVQGTPNGYFVDASGNTNAQLQPVIFTLSEHLQYSNWYFKYSGIGSFAQPSWDLVKTKLAGHSERMYEAYLGFNGGDYAFIFRSLYGTSSLYGGALNFTFTEINENKIKLEFAFTATGDGVWYYQNASFSAITNALGAPSAKTYSLSTDNPNSPKWIKLTDDANPNNTYTLSRSRVVYPFDK